MMGKTALAPEFLTCAANCDMSTVVAGTGKDPANLPPSAIVWALKKFTKNAVPGLSSGNTATFAGLSVADAPIVAYALASCTLPVNGNHSGLVTCTLSSPL